jgi:hypothetical protein
MPEDRIDNTETLLKQVTEFAEKIDERRQFERKALLWAASIEVRGQRFEGAILDFSPGGARIKFDAPMATGDELNIVLKQFDTIGAKVIWQRQGEAGVKFLLAPEDVAALVQDKLPLAVPKAPAGAGPPRPSPSPSAPAVAPSRRLAVVIAGAVVGVGSLIGGAVVIASGGGEGKLPPLLALNLGSANQRSCTTLMDRAMTATNQLDFSLHVASALQAKCLDVHHLGPSDNDRDGRMVKATKVLTQ